MKFGFTGTRKGMTDLQRESLFGVMELQLGVSFIVLGGAEGADWEVYQWARENPLVSTIWVFPAIGGPDYGIYARTRTPRPPLARNRDIVNAVDSLLVAPAGMREERRSGTWATYRYAKKAGKSRWIFWPNGEISFECGGLVGGHPKDDTDGP